MRIVIFEDAGADGFAPIALTRPVFELLCGHFSLRERLIRALDVHEWGALVRPWLAEVYKEDHSESHVNDFAWLGTGPTLCINGRWLGSADAIADLTNAGVDSAAWCDNTLAWLVLDPDESVLLSDQGWSDPLLKIASTRQRVDVEGVVVRHPWDLVDVNARQIEADFRQQSLTGGKATLDEVAVLGPPTNVFIHPSAELDPFVVIDARKGPVFIDMGVRVQAFTRLEGPCFIGRQSQLFRANVKAGTSIGPVCRVGGEIEAAIMHGHANKYHDGFLGHSYICPWVNLGALTTNSDLKNDYSSVRVPLSGDPIDSGSTKVGCFIGDHSKTALCSQFNTGSSIGVMAMILPGGELLPKHVPSFARIWHGAIDDSQNLDDCLNTARIAMGRRDCEFTLAQERLLRHLYKATSTERQAAVARFQQRRKRTSASL